jgi:hypothetical protein
LGNLRKRIALLGCTALFVGLSAVPANAAPEQTLSSSEVEARLDKFVAEHPRDLVGLNELAKQLTGEGTRVSLNNEGEVTPAHAQSVLDGKNSRTARAIPSDAFDVYVTYAPLAPGSRQLKIYDQWNWRDDFVGQGAPEDIAELQLSIPDGCVRHGNLGANTGKWDGAITNRATLRDAGVSTRSPIWNINDGTSGFENLTDNGYITATLDASQCTVGGPAQIGFAFTYEANRGGSVVSVSAGFGGLSVSYANQGDVFKKSSQPIWGAL